MAKNEEIKVGALNLEKKPDDFHSTFILFKMTVKDQFYFFRSRTKIIFEQYLAHF